MKKVDAILTADWHLREDTPTCRTDNFWQTQWNKVEQVAQLQAEYDCPVLHSGDLFHNWKASPYLLAKSIRHLPDNFWTVYGNHDLPYHSMTQAEKSAVYTLSSAGALNVLKGCHFGGDPHKSVLTQFFNRPVLVWHKMVWHKDKPYPGVLSTDSATAILKKYGKIADLILTGDNHRPFDIGDSDKRLVNPGPITRQTVIDDSPRVYLWCDETNEIEIHWLEHNKDAVSREHIDFQKDRDERLGAFVERLDEGWEVELSYEKNLKSYAEANKVPNEIMEVVYDCIG